MGKNNDLEQMILQELVLQPILEFIVDKFAEELLKEDNGDVLNTDNSKNQKLSVQQALGSSPKSGLSQSESESSLLTGRISNTNYLWHTNPNACQKCQDLDGTVYINKYDVPNKPHPNCKCEIEELEEQEDKCHCLDGLFEQIDNIISNAENLLSNLNNYIEYFSNLTNAKIKNSIAKRILDNCIEGLQQIAGTINDFIKNYSDIKHKYIHTASNCKESIKREFSKIVEKAISEYKNIQNLISNILEKSKNATATQNEEKILDSVTSSSQKSSQNNNKESNTIEEVYQYIQNNNKAPHTHITQNIYWDEVVKYPSLNYEKPTIEILENLYKTAVKIQEFRDKYYPNSKIQINSGWRSKGYNDTLGNAHPNSEHLYGNAIDFKIIGQDINSVYTNIKQYWKGRYYIHTTYGFIHVDRTRERGIDLVW